MSREKAWTMLTGLLDVQSITGERSNEVIRVVAKHLDENDIPYQIHKFEDQKDKDKIYYGLSAEKGEQDKVITLVCHLDVVNPASKEQWDWKSDGDLIIGRGVADAKGPASMAIQAFIDTDVSNSQNKLQLFVTTDEEIGGINGAKRLFEIYQSSQDDFAIAIEPVGKIITKFFGILRFFIEIVNEESHTKTGNLNAINTYRELSQRIQDHLNSLGKDQMLGYSLYNPTFISSGSKTGDGTNPGFLYAKVDVRVIPNIDPNDLYQAIVDIAGVLEDECKLKDSSAKIAVEKTIYGPPLFADLNHPYVKKLQALGYETGFSRGSSDAKWATCPAVEVGPQGDDIHGPNERIRLSDLYSFYDDLMKFLK